MSEDPVSQDGLRSEMRRSLVERLRIPWEGMSDMANQQRAEAAVQIKTMMDELEALRLSIDRMVDKLNAERDAVRRERDEARREVCNMKDFHGLPRDYALERGWDCFRENTND